MTELDVTLTDFALSLECLLFAWLVLRGSNGTQPLGRWFALYFASVGVAALCGGLVHGFFSDGASLGARVLWPTTILAAGFTALSCWAIGATLLFSQRTARVVVAAAVVELVCFGYLVLFQTTAFWIAVADNLPAVLFLLAAIVIEFRRGGDRQVLLAACGLLLTMIAALLQQLQVAVHPVYFTHNALFHVVQMGAMLLMLLGALRLVDRTATSPPTDELATTASSNESTSL